MLFKLIDFSLCHSSSSLKSQGYIQLVWNSLDHWQLEFNQIVSVKINKFKKLKLNQLGMKHAKIFHFVLLKRSSTN